MDEGHEEHTAGQRDSGLVVPSRLPIEGGVARGAGNHDATHPASNAHRAEHQQRARIEQAGHVHAGHGVVISRDRFFVSLLLTMPTLIWGHMLEQAFGFTAPHVPGGDYFPRTGVRRSQ